MASSGISFEGVVEELWRYPVKSMLGEELNETELTERGLLGDRAYALRDKSDGKIATAKNPRKWPSLFDIATVHILTRAPIECLQELYPQGRFEVPRFRPNVVVKATDGSKGFVENDWLGRIIAVGEKVRLKVDLNCARCVMTTLAQRDLPKDSRILRTAAQHNHVNVGVYAS